MGDPTPIDTTIVDRHSHGGGGDISHIPITTAKFGVMNCYVQGDLNNREGKTVFLTVHDMGTNHKSMINFVNHPSMADVKNKSIFIHICVPGQEDHAEDWLKAHPMQAIQARSGQLASAFPSLEDIGCALDGILDHLDVKTCVGVGEGAGANIICRFAMQYPNRAVGLVLIHCTSTTAGLMEYMKDKYINMKLEAGKMDQTAWNYLTTHKFGPRADEKSDFVKAYINEMTKVLNPNNLSLYLTSFMKRTDLSAVLAETLPNMDVLLVVGSKASYVHTVYTMHQSMNRERTTLLVVDGVGDVVSEAPEKLTRGLILFCKGIGVLSGVAMPGMERQRSLSKSMEEADRPRKMSLGTSN